MRLLKAILLTAPIMVANNNQLIKKLSCKLVANDNFVYCTDGKGDNRLFENDLFIHEKIESFLNETLIND